MFYKILILCILLGGYKCFSLTDDECNKSVPSLSLSLLDCSSLSDKLFYALLQVCQTTPYTDTYTELYLQISGELIPQNLSILINDSTVCERKNDTYKCMISSVPLFFNQCIEFQVKYNCSECESFFNVSLSNTVYSQSESYNVSSNSLIFGINNCTVVPSFDFNFTISPFDSNCDDNATFQLDVNVNQQVNSSLFFVFLFFNDSLNNLTLGGQPCIMIGNTQTWQCSLYPSQEMNYSNSYLLQFNNSFLCGKVITGYSYLSYDNNSLVKNESSVTYVDCSSCVIPIPPIPFQYSPSVIACGSNTISIKTLLTLSIYENFTSVGYLISLSNPIISASGLSCTVYNSSLALCMASPNFIGNIIISVMFSGSCLGQLNSSVVVVFNTKLNTTLYSDPYNNTFQCTPCPPDPPISVNYVSKNARCFANAIELVALVNGSAGFLNNTQITIVIDYFQYNASFALIDNGIPCIISSNGSIICTNIYNTMVTSKGILISIEGISPPIDCQLIYAPSITLYYQSFSSNTSYQVTNNNVLISNCTCPTTLNAIIYPLSSKCEQGNFSVLLSVILDYPPSSTSDSILISISLPVGVSFGTVTANGQFCNTNCFFNTIPIQSVYNYTLEFSQPSNISSICPFVLLGTFGISYFNSGSGNDLSITLPNQLIGNCTDCNVIIPKVDFNPSGSTNLICDDVQYHYTEVIMSTSAYNESLFTNVIVFIDSLQGMNVNVTFFPDAQCHPFNFTNTTIVCTLSKMSSPIPILIALEYPCKNTTISFYAQFHSIYGYSVQSDTEIINFTCNCLFLNPSITDVTFTPKCDTESFLSFGILYNNNYQVSSIKYVLYIFNIECMNMTIGFIPGCTNIPQGLNCSYSVFIPFVIRFPPRCNDCLFNIKIKSINVNNVQGLDFFSIPLKCNCPTTTLPSTTSISPTVTSTPFFVKIPSFKSEISFNGNCQEPFSTILFSVEENGFDYSSEFIFYIYTDGGMKISSVVPTQLGFSCFSVNDTFVKCASSKMFGNESLLVIFSSPCVDSVIHFDAILSSDYPMISNSKEIKCISPCPTKSPTKENFSISKSIDDCKSIQSIGVSPSIESSSSKLRMNGYCEMVTHSKRTLLMNVSFSDWKFSSSSSDHCYNGSSMNVNDSKILCNWNSPIPINSTIIDVNCYTNISCSEDIEESFVTLYVDSKVFYLEFQCVDNDCMYKNYGQCKKECKDDCYKYITHKDKYCWKCPVPLRVLSNTSLEIKIFYAFTCFVFSCILIIVIVVLVAEWRNRHSYLKTISNDHHSKKRNETILEFD